MQNHSRQIFIYDLEIASRKKGAVIPTMEELALIFQKMKDTGRTYPIRDNTAVMLIGDIQVDTREQCITMLIRISDRTASDSVTSDPDSEFFTIHTKGPNQGSDFACHVIVSTAPELNLPNVYTCVIERVVGLPSSLVQRLLSKLLHYEFHDDPKSFSYPHPGGGFTTEGAPRTDRCCPHIELSGRLSDTLIDDINNGHITGVSLIKAESVTPLAGAPFLKKKESELRLQIDHKSLPKNLFQRLLATFQANAQAYGIAKLSYKRPNSRSSTTISLNATTGSPIDQMYVKSFEINGIFPVLNLSSLKIVNHFQTLIIPEFMKNRTI